MQISPDPLTTQDREPGVYKVLLHLTSGLPQSPVNHTSEYSFSCSHTCRPVQCYVPLPLHLLTLRGVWSLEGVPLFFTSSLAAYTYMGLLTSLPPPCFPHPTPSYFGEIYTPSTSHRLTWLPPCLPSHLACTLDSDDRPVLFPYITLSNYALKHFILLIPPPPHSQYLHRD